MRSEGVGMWLQKSGWIYQWCGQDLPMGRGLGPERSPQPLDAGSLVEKLPQPPDARWSGAGDPSDGRLLQFFNKNNAFL